MQIENYSSRLVRDFFMNKVRTISFFILAMLCINSLGVLASGYRTYYPVPVYGSSLAVSNTYDNVAKDFLKHNNQQVMMIATMIVIVSIVYYVYQQHYHNQAQEKALTEMKSYVEKLKEKLDGCIDSIPMPSMVNAYLKESLAKSIAEYVANGRKAALRYVQKNKKYFISLTAAPTGMFLGYPVMGGAVAMLGVMYGAIQSAREEIAEFRQETEKLFAETNKNVKEGFQNAEENAENNKKEVLNKIETEVGSLSQKIGEITVEIQKLHSDVGNKVDGVGEKVEVLSGELQKATEQMIQLHSDRDEKDEELIKKLENATDKLTGAKQEIVALIENMIQESGTATREQIGEIQKQLSQVKDDQLEKTKVLIDVQTKISELLDRQEHNDKQATQLLDSVRSSNLSLEEIHGNVQRQEKAFTNFGNVLDDVQKKIQNNRDDLLKAVAESVEQCSDLSSKVQQLEKRVEDNHLYTVNGFEKISKQNVKLKNMIKRMQQEKEQLSSDLKTMKEEQQKTNFLLDQLVQKSDNNADQVKRLVEFTEQYPRTSQNKKKSNLYAISFGLNSSDCHNHQLSLMNKNNDNNS